MFPFIPGACADLDYDSCLTDYHVPSFMMVLVADTLFSMIPLEFLIYNI